MSIFIYCLYTHNGAGFHLAPGSQWRYGLHSSIGSHSENGFHLAIGSQNSLGFHQCYGSHQSVGFHSRYGYILHFKYSLKARLTISDRLAPVFSFSFLSRACSSCPMPINNFFMLTSLIFRYDNILMDIYCQVLF